MKNITIIIICFIVLNSMAQETGSESYPLENTEISDSAGGLNDSVNGTSDSMVYEDSGEIGSRKDMDFKDNFCSDTSVTADIIDGDTVSEDQKTDSLSDDSAETSEELPPIEKMPELEEFVEAEYPDSLQKKGVEGSVLMELLVNDTGIVESVFLAEGVHPALDSSALAAAKKFIFKPAEAGGETVPVFLRYEYTFSLKNVVEKIDRYVNFSGKVVERGTRDPVTDAMVVINFTDTSADTTLPVPFNRYLEHLNSFEGQYLEENRLVTITDSAGYFSFYSLPAGDIEVTVPQPGYEAFFERERITYNEELDVTYYLTRFTYSEYEIVGYGKKETKEVSRRKLTLQEVKKVPGMSGDAVRVIQAMPGVARPSFGSGAIVVRGAPTGDTQFLLDGIEIPMLYHFGGFKSVYNSEALESIDFYPGGFGVKYGNAVAGVVELKGRKAKKDRWHGYADASFLDGSFLVEGPLGKKVSLLATARRSFIGELIGKAAEVSPDAPVLTIAPFYWDYIMRTDYDINNDNHVYLTFFGMKNEQKLVMTDLSRGGSSEIGDQKDAINTKIYFHQASLGYDADITDRLSNELRTAATFSRFDNSFFGYFDSEQTMWSYYLKDKLQFEYSDRLSINAGADINIAPLDLRLEILSNENEPQRDTTENWIFGDIAGYLYAEIKPFERLTLIPGLRYDFYPELDYNGSQIPEFWNYEFDNKTRFNGEPAFRFTTRYNFIDNHTLKIAAGSYSETPEPMGQAIHESWGNPSLPATLAAHYVAGHEWQITDLIHTDLQFYINRQWDDARTPSERERKENSSLKPYIANGKRKMRGIEIMLRHDPSERFFGWISYSLSKSRFYSYNENRWAVAGKDQTHNLIAVGSWKIPGNWEAGFKLQYTTGDPFTPDTGSVYDETFHYFDAQSGMVNTERFKPTFQLDLRIEKKFIFPKWILTTYADFFNIGYFLYKSPQAKMRNPAEPYNPETGESNFQYINQPSFPSIGIKASF